jgi:CelD/BcsL family acetyltransferase involved in cellulose biosynthesis
MLGAGVELNSVAEVEEISDPLLFRDLREDWDRLLETSTSDCLFLTWEWLYAWWKHVGGRRRLRLLVLRRDRTTIGIMPLGWSPPGLPQGAPFGVLEFLGSGQAGSDYLDVIAHEGNEDVVCAAFASYLGRTSDVCKWTNLRSGATAHGMLPRLAKGGWSVTESITNLCPYIRLTGETWESYLAQLGSEHRYNFRRKWKRLNREHVVGLETVCRQDECRESIDLLIRLHNLRWSSRGGTDAFHTPALVGLHREFAAVALDRGWLRLHTLRVDGHPAACLCGYQYHGKFYFYQSGFDPAYETYGVGVILMGLAVQRAIEEKSAEFDFLHGNEAYKSHWSHDSRELHRLELYPPGVAGRLIHASVDLARASRRVARRVLGKCE